MLDDSDVTAPVVLEAVLKLESHTIQSGGHTREYDLHLPDPMPPTPPLVISLHGGAGRSMAPRFAEHADSGIVFAFPAGIGVYPGDHNWVSLGDDAKDPDVDVYRDEVFLLAMIERIRTRLPFGPVYICGFSSGAKQSMHMIARHPTLFAGAGLVSHGLPLAMLPIPAIPPVRYVVGDAEDQWHGTPDRIGGRATAERLIAARGLDTRPDAALRVVARGDAVRTVTRMYGSSAQYVRVRGGEHAWPSVDGGYPSDEAADLLSFWGLR